MLSNIKISFNQPSFFDLYLDYFIIFGMKHESLVKQCLIYNLKGGQIPWESLQYIIPGRGWLSS